MLNKPWLLHIIFPVFLLFIIQAMPFQAAAFTCHEWTEVSSECTTAPVLCEETPERPGNHVTQAVSCDGGGQIVTCSWCTAPDEDDDGIVDSEDNCPLTANPDQLDTDSDGDGDACDNDDDNDSVTDDAPDNCPLDANADQADMDGDGIGDVCDPDMDGDGLSNDSETRQGTDPAAADLINWVDDDDITCGGHTPDCYDTIQAAINASGGTTGYNLVVVRDGVYTGTGNRDLDFNGKGIIVRSENGSDTTIIDCEKQGRGFYFHNSETRSSVVDGFTIRNGYIYQTYDETLDRSSGAAICMEAASPTVRHCNFTDNTSVRNGGAVAVMGTGRPVVENCVFTGNRAYFYGGAFSVVDGNMEDNLLYAQIVSSGNVYTGNNADKGGAVYVNFGYYGRPEFILKDSVLETNRAKKQGGAVFFDRHPGSGSAVVNCTIVNNTAPQGSAIWIQIDSGVSSFSSITLLNSIVWGNENNDDSGQIHLISLDDELAVVVDHSLLEGGLTGVVTEEGTRVTSVGSVIKTDPDFVFDDNYHLDSGSPCINAGDSETPFLSAHDLDGSNRTIGESVDLGAYEYGGLNAPGIVVSPASIEFAAVLDQGSETITDKQQLLLRSYATETSRNWQVTIPADCSWLKTDAELEGDSAGEIDRIAFWADTEGLGHGIHECSLTIIADNDPGAAITVPVTFRVSSTLTVPDDYTTIQAAIDAAVDGDTVFVRSGTYTGDGNKNIHFRGKGIRVVAEEDRFSIIDCEHSGTGFFFDNGETSESVLKGFKIINGQISGGGAVCVMGASPVISDCLFENNACIRADERIGEGGAAMLINNSDVLFLNCEFKGNTNVYDGGAVCADSSAVEFRGCVFKGNLPPYGWGGAVRGRDSTVAIHSCQFIQNGSSSTIVRRGGAIAWTGSADRTLLITNSTFDRNESNDFGGAIYAEGPGDMDLANNTFAGNGSDEAYGGAIYIRNVGGRIINSIFINNHGSNGRNFAEDEEYLNPEFPALSFNGFYPAETDYAGSCTDCIQLSGAPGLSDDFHLEADSPFVDAGTPITGMYTDQRGSVRPVDGPDADTTPQFDMGAFEYSANYSGAEDGVVSAFRDVRVKSPTVIIGFEYLLVWKDKDPFPWEDPRFSQAGEYTVRFVLVNELGRRIDLGTYTKTKGPSGVDYEYSVDYTFNRSHIGTWYLRIEIADAPELYALSDSPFSIGEGTAKIQIIGEVVPNPLADDNPYRDVMPDLDPDESFYWSAFSNTLYAVRPGTGIVTWYEDAYRAVPVPLVVTSQMPETVQFHIVNTPEVALLPEGSPYESVQIMYSTSGAKLVGSQFSAVGEGYTVLLYYDDDEGIETLEVVRSVLWDNPDYFSSRTWNIGQAIVEADLHDPACGSGWVLNEISPYDGAGDARAYDRDERTGPIIPVNVDRTADDTGDDLIVIWYEKGITGADWPHTAVRYIPRWPDEPQDLSDPADADRVPVAGEDMKTIQIGSSLGSGPLVAATYGNPDQMITYSQPDQALPGFNPNEEHAFLATSLDGTANEPAMFAMKNDLNGDLSEPYVLLKYRNPAADDEWAMAVFKVTAPGITGLPKYTSMTLNGVSGMLLNPPYPLSSMYFNPCDGNRVADYSPDGSAWEDKNGELWAMNPDNGNPTLNYWYPLKEGFYYDLDNDGEPDAAVGECIPWKMIHDGESDARLVAVTYEVCWPDQCPEPRELPVLQVGETLMDAKNGLPNIKDQCSVGLEYGSDKARLIDPMIERSVDLEEFFETSDSDKFDALLETLDAIDFDEELPFHLSVRFSCENTDDSKTMSFIGYYDDSMAGEPLLLPNIMSEADRDILLDLDISEDGGTLYKEAVNELFEETRSYMDAGKLSSYTAESKALTAGAAESEGYVILSFNNAEDDEGEALCASPVVMSVIRVECPSYTGDIKVIEPENVFDNRVTLRHSGDFGGDPDQVVFQWKWMDYVSNPPEPDDPDWNVWYEADEDYPGEQGSKTGSVEIVVEGPGDKTLSDKWFIVRSYMENGPCGEWSEWTQPQLYQGWVKRVLAAINLFDQRIKDFEDYAPNTLASMIQQAGERYEGDAALNYDPDNLDSLGLIEFYQTLLNLSCDLTIDASEPIHTSASDQTLLLAAGRLTDLFMLLGNDAYADAVDPTIGFSTDDSGEYGSAVTSIFCFQNQVASLLEEELALLRGRDEEGVNPYYNHLVWNFTQTEGEVAYRQNYNIYDWDGDGLLTEYDARAYYPQGHGDAWGYYLTGLKIYYDLLRHPYYVWEPRPESLLVAGTAISVDYEDERQFAAIAAAKARTGAEVVDLTYRQRYDESGNDQLDGYRDANTERAWGVDEWAARAGQAAYFDWVTANAVLPARDLQDCRRDGADPGDCHEGLALVDRTTVVELVEIPTTFSQIQTMADKADAGLNPLGLAKGAVPFDFDPTFDEVGSGIQNVVYFEQMYERAVEALNNAVTVFDHANENTQLLYQQYDSIGDFQVAVEAEERSFNNDLIEIYGYPYPEDCGPGKTYSTDYCEEGPDLVHWMYVDVQEDIIDYGSEWVSSDAITVNLVNDDYSWDSGELPFASGTITFNYVESPDFNGFVKPATWEGSRRQAPGELQLAYSDMLQLIGEYKQAYTAYSNLLLEIQDTTRLVEQQISLADRTNDLQSRTLGAKVGINTAIVAAKAAELGFGIAADKVVDASESVITGLPDVVGMVVGFSNGVITDAMAPVKAVTQTTGEALGTTFEILANIAELGGVVLELSKETVEMANDLSIDKYENRQEIKSALLELQQLIRSEAEQRIELSTLLEGINQARANIDAIKARGMRLLEERLVFRTLTAADVQTYRYKDMAFRLFRDDALRKYRSQFDMAALYTYLAAKAYDYETALLDSDTSAGKNFLADIVRQRSIGQVEDGEPLTGTGLADILKRMKLNFMVFKPQMGLNNPQFETNQFSLRRELFRFLPDEGSDGKWREILAAARVDDLWQVPEFRRYCRPFAEEGVAQPGIVLRFSTDVTAGRNFFGRLLGGGDSYYSAANFATKIWSAGLWFTNYDSSGLAMTPRVYLVPVGEDILRSPTDNSGNLRTWQVVDQKIPTPFPVSSAELVNNPNWIPHVDSLQDDLFGIRRHGDFRAYHDSGYVDESEMTYDARLIGRSVWNTEWLLIIPGQNLYYDAEEGVERFISGPETYSGSGVRTDNGVKDIKLYFYTYSFTGD